MKNSNDLPHPDDLTTMHVRRAVAGNADSQGWIVQRFTPLLLAQARYRMRGDLGQMAEPADVVNDVWLRVLPRLDQLTPEQRYTPTLVSYLSRAIILQINNLLRKMLRRRGRGDIGAVGGEGVPEAAAEHTGIVTRVVRSENEEVVAKAIDALPEADREAIVLRAIEQHPNPIAAEMLGVSPGTLAVRYHRALKKLRTELAGSIFDEFELEDDAS